MTVRHTHETQHVAVNPIDSDHFRSEPFDDLHFNLHKRFAGRTRSVAIFIHGFGGNGYSTWGDFPHMLFTGGPHHQFDVAIFDYDSGARTILTRGSRLGHDAERLVAGIRELSQVYSSVYLISHSLGGIVAEEAIIKYLNHLSHTKEEYDSSIAALFVFASPRAGTGWANPLLVYFVREFRWLKRFSSKTTDIEKFFTNHVQSRAVANTGGLPYLIPRYACIGNRDAVVSEFSAAFGIPDIQKKFLVGNHRSIAKPTPGNSPQVVWLTEKIKATDEIRKQYSREQDFRKVQSSDHSANESVDRGGIITELWHDTAGAGWTVMYNEVLRAAVSDGVPVRDVSESSWGEPQVDLLVSIHDADSVIQSGDSEQQRVMSARNRLEDDDRLTVGIAPVGEQSHIAHELIDKWLQPNRPAKHFFVEAANDRESLQEVVWRWLHSIVGRRYPLRRQAQFRTMADRIVDLDTPIEDYYGKGAYL